MLALVIILSSVPQGAGAVSASTSSVFLSENSNGALYELGNSSQKIAVSEDGGSLRILTYIQKEGTWHPFFNAGLPLLQGDSFNLLPDTASVQTDTASEKTLKLSGAADAGYGFDIYVTAREDSPLLQFRIVSHLTSALDCEGTQPVSMLWMDAVPGDRVTVYQESPNYQTLDDSVYWNSAFPAVYLWSGGLESAVFFRMEDMDWFSFKTGVNRFKSIQVRASVRDGRLGIGMDLRRSMGDGTVVAAGDMVVEFFLYGAAESQKPSKLTALGKLVDAFGECFPSQSSYEPYDYVADAVPTYQAYSAKVAEQLMLENVTYKITPFSKLRNQVSNAVTGVWSDGPLFSEDTVEDVLRRPDYAVGNLNGHNMRYPADIYGDWNCVNNTLIPWIAFERLNPDQEQREMIDLGLSALKVYYDPDAKLIRSFESSDDYKNAGVEFGFQNFFFSINTLKASQLRDPDDFDPALAGKYLMGLEGLIELAHNVNYAFPQLFSAKDKVAATSLDEAHLGKPFDVWTGAVYAYNMCMAYDWTGDSLYLSEAAAAVDALFEGLTFTVENSVFEKTFTDPYEFPVNEVSSAPWGVAAAQWLYGKTGDAKYLTYSEHFRNITLRLMAWYESSLRDDPVDQEVPGAGLFRDFSVTDTTSAWENIMTYLPLLMEIKNTDIEPSGLLLKMFNVYKDSAFYMHGPSWDPAVIGQYATNFTKHPAGYMAVEDYYTAETPTAMGLSGPTVYMSNSSFYAYLLFEAFSGTNDSDILALNLDYVDAPTEMMNGASRSFVYYNPTGEAKSFTAAMKELSPSASYSLTLRRDGQAATQTYTGAQLMNGFSLTLGGEEYVRAQVTLLDAQTVSEYDLTTEAQQRLSLSYQYLQQAAREFGADEALLALKEDYLAALSLYDSQDYSGSVAAVNAFIDEIPLISYPGHDTALLDAEDISPYNRRSGQNITSGAYASADSGAAGRVADGGLGEDNTWISGEDSSHYVILDLGSSKAIGRYRLTHGGGSENTDSFMLLSSDDKASWVLRDSVSGNTRDVTDHALAPFTARYVKLVITKSDQADGQIARIRELELFDADIYSENGQILTANSLNLLSTAALSGDGNGAALAGDGEISLTSMWTASEGDALIAQLSSPAEIGRWVLRHAGLAGSQEQTAAAFSLYSSDDGETWTLRDQVTGNTDETGGSGGTTPPGETPSGEPVVYELNTTSNLIAEGGATAVPSASGITVTGKNGQNVKKKITMNLSTHPILEITFSDIAPGQSVHLQAWDEVVGAMFIVDAAIGQNGAYTLDIPAKTGWSGEKTFHVIFYPQSSTEASFTVSSLRALPSGYVPPVTEPLADDFTDLSAWKYTENANIAAAASGAKVTCTAGTFGYVAKKAVVDLDSTPRLRVLVPEIPAGSKFHIMVNDGTGSDIFLSRTEMTASGEYNFDLPVITGWTGEKTVTIKLAVIGGAGSYVRLQSLETIGAPQPTMLTNRRVEPFTASYLKLVIDEPGSSGSAGICEWEAYAGETPSYDAIASDGQTAAVSTGYYHTASVSRLAGYNVTAYPRITADVASVTPGATWALQVQDSLGGPSYLLTSASQTGVSTFDLASVTGWQGLKGYTLTILVYGGTDQSVTFRSITASESPSTPEPEGPGNPASPGNPVEQIDDTTPPLSGGFSDLDSVPWAKDAIETLYGMGVVGGMGDGLYHPGKTVTRAQLIKMALLSLGITGDAPDPGYTDVSPSSWYYPYAALANAHGITGGSVSDAFSPDKPVTRQDAALILAQAVAAAGKTLPDAGAAPVFTDSQSISEYAREAAALLAKNGVILGHDTGAFALQETCTRAQAATMLYRLLKALGTLG